MGVFVVAKRPALRRASAPSKDRSKAFFVLLGCTVGERTRKGQMRSCTLNELLPKRIINIKADAIRDCIV